MKSDRKTKSIILVLFVIAFSLSHIITPNLQTLQDNKSINYSKDLVSPKLSSPNKTLLHMYDFESDIIGQDPSGVTLVVNEPTGCTANIETLGDGQQKHVALYKGGGSTRVMLRDNISYYGEVYDVGELHFNFYHDTSLFGIWIMDSGGILFRLDFWSGNVGQWAISNIITSYTLNQWTNIIIYYDISKGWMFDLNSVRFGGDYGYDFEHGSPSGIRKMEWVSAASGGGDGFFRIDDIVFYYETENLISICTPQSKVYSKPMDGYYPATYGFECDEKDDFPKGWNRAAGWVNGHAKVIDGISGHNKVLRCYSSSADLSRVDTCTLFDPQVKGTFEFWWYKSSSYTSAAIVDFWGEEPGACISIRADHWPTENNDKIEYQTGAGYFNTGYPNYADNKWIHIRIDFDCSSDTYSLWIDNVKYLYSIDFINSKDETGINQMRFDSYNAANAVLYYVDAVSFSWEPNYDVRDNLNEGLLLSFENSTALDWVGYSLDGNETVTILGNTTISIPENGVYTIQVFGNDTLGNPHNSDLRYFTVDLITSPANTHLVNKILLIITLTIIGCCIIAVVVIAGVIVVRKRTVIFREVKKEKRSLRKAPSLIEEKPLEMLCPECGNQIEPEVSVCIYCGNLIKEPSLEATIPISVEEETRDLNVFLSYSTLDRDYFQISKIVRRLEFYPEINDVLFWEEDSKQNIVEFMEETLDKTNVFVLFCTQNSKKSKAVKGEWQSAYQIVKAGLMKIIPVYEEQKDIPKLLWQMLNVKFTKDDFDEFIENLYNEILR
ncbi:MAG: TIR domain-containing protein [Candidatus Lokiarchaeota archaeon]|nr:TIR domain-containing protein [Candidatus Lokiarchaeota archaeon]